MNKVLTTSITIFTCFWSAYSWAGTSLMELYWQATGSDLNLTRSKLYLEQAETAFDIAKAPSLPQLSAYAGYQAEAVDDIDVKFDQGVGHIGLGLSQTLYNASISEQIKSYGRQTASQAFNYQSQQQRLILQVFSAYIAAIKAKDEQQLVYQSLLAIEEHLKQTKQRFEVGLIANTDVFEAQAIFDSRQVDLIKARTGYRDALRAIAIITGQTPDDINSFRNPLQLPMLPERSDREWLSVSRLNNPVLQGLKERALAADYQVAAVKSQRLPQVDLNLDVIYTDYLDESISDIAQTFGDHSATKLALSVAVPLITGGKISSQLQQQYLNQSMVELEITQFERELEVEVYALTGQLVSNQQNISASKQTIKSRASALKAIKVGYEVGSRSVLELLNAQVAMADAELAYRFAQYDFVLTQLRLKFWSGEIAEQDLKHLDLLLEY